ncbi:hypothetical protein WJX75_006919 [Coccomyxa subellipsoidea]|uniref:RWP-RK domain-containing protein n=1 Tax=Coccomyxa subellipsoidea TaxID=248742 RepID=A0ABR2YS69_9CHLO
MKLAQVVVKFTSSLSSTGTGTLSQIWLPSISEDGSVVLGTQGVPFSVSGTVDLLALFRCISCRFKFTTDVTDPSNMGVVGRVFASGEPEFSHNVQTYNKSVYLRVSDAQRCRVHSTMLLPMYMEPQRDHPFAVFEVCQTEKNVLFPSLVDLFQRCLEDVNLYTVDIEKHSMGIGLRADSLQRLKAASGSGAADTPAEDPPRASSGAKGEKTADSEDKGGRAGQGLPLTSTCQLPTPFQDPHLQQGGSVNGSHFTTYGMPAQKQGGGKSEGMARLVSVGNRLELDLEPLPMTSKGGGGGHCALESGRQWSEALGSKRPSMRLEVGLPDAAAAMQTGFEGEKAGFAGQLSTFGIHYAAIPPREMAQFGVGLREAAANLRICPTTLKRACRRHGITRWPRRQLAKLNRSEGSKSDGSGDLPHIKVEGSYRSGGRVSGQQPAVSSAASPRTSSQLGAERREGVTTRSFSAATSAGRAAIPEGSSPGILSSLDFPSDIQQQPFYLSGNPSSTGILDLFQSIGPTGSAGMVQQSHGGPILHPDDMLW